MTDNTYPAPPAPSTTTTTVTTAPTTSTTVVHDSGLPNTGADISGLSVLGFMVLAIGAVVVYRFKRTR